MFAGGEKIRMCGKIYLEILHTVDYVRMYTNRWWIFWKHTKTWSHLLPSFQELRGGVILKVTSRVEETTALWPKSICFHQPKWKGRRHNKSILSVRISWYCCFDLCIFGLQEPRLQNLSIKTLQKPLSSNMLQWRICWKFIQVEKVCPGGEVLERVSHQHFSEQISIRQTQINSLTRRLELLDKTLIQKLSIFLSKLYLCYRESSSSQMWSRRY